MNLVCAGARRPVNRSALKVVVAPYTVRGAALVGTWIAQNAGLGA